MDITINFPMTRALAGALLATSLLPSFALAGQESSGGGNAVVCFDDRTIPDQIRSGSGQILDQQIAHIISIEAYDLYEARMPRGMDGHRPEVIPISDSESVDDYVEKIKGRFDHYIPGISLLIGWGQTTFPPTNIVWQPGGLQKVDDANEVGRIPDHCVLGTAVMQFNEGNASFLHFDERLFNHPRHSKLSKAVLMIHEYLYSQARAIGQRDSRNTRVLLSALITRGPQQPISYYLDLMSNLGFYQRFQKETILTYVPQVLVRAMLDLTSIFDSETKLAEWKKSDPALIAKVDSYFKQISKGAVSRACHVNSIDLQLDDCYDDLKFAYDKKQVVIGYHHGEKYRSLTPQELSNLQSLMSEIAQSLEIRIASAKASANRKYEETWRSEIDQLPSLTDQEKQNLQRGLRTWLMALERGYREGGISFRKNFDHSLFRYGIEGSETSLEVAFDDWPNSGNLMQLDLPTNHPVP